MKAGEKYYAQWAPEQSVWSPWVKPVLFTQMEMLAEDVSKARAVASKIGWEWVPGERDREALVVDVSGAGSVWMGAILAGHGYRPVPLFNGVPGPDRWQEHSVLVQVKPIIEALAAYGDDVAAARLADDAPPAFLIDAERMAPSERVLTPGKFDNRWMVFPQDFPSAKMLMAHGVKRVLLVRMSDTKCADDLAHVMLRWQKAGLELEVISLEQRGRAEPLKVRKPRWFGWAWQRLMVMSGLRRNSAGGFGAIIPMPSESSGGGGWG